MQVFRVDVAEPATIVRASSIVFLPKKDGSLRFFADYRRLNTGTVCDNYSIPRMGECIDSIGKERIFSILDADSEATGKSKWTRRT